MIGKADASVSITWADVDFDGNAHPASASVSGVGSPAEDLGDADSLTYYAGATATGTPLAGAPTDAGTYTVKADFDGNGNYKPASATKTIVIDQADTTTTVTCGAGPFTYNGSAHTPCSANVTGPAGLDRHADRRLQRQHERGHRDGERLLRRHGELQGQQRLGDVRDRQGGHDHGGNLHRRSVQLQRLGPHAVYGKGDRSGWAQRLADGRATATTRTRARPRRAPPTPPRRTTSPAATRRPSRSARPPRVRRSAVRRASRTPARHSSRARRS